MKTINESHFSMRIVEEDPEALVVYAFYSVPYAIDLSQVVSDLF